MRSAPTQVPEVAPTEAEDAYQPGELVDKKHRLVRTLGKGGMGTLWVAHNLVLDVHVAVKLIRLQDEAASTKQLAERLLQEARAAAKLGHPSIVRVFDFGKSRRGDPFVVMELLHGETLAETLQQETRVPAIRAIQTVLPIADALMAAHAKGIVHRDVKPENIILSKAEDGRIQPKLLDFGIASFVDRDKKFGPEGTVVGTPAYMSPEQASGKPDIGPRSDIWSMCVLLYELTTGKLPFEGDSYAALASAILSDNPKPLHELGAGDEALWAILERGLQKEPEDRWPDVKAFGAALARWLCERGVWDDVCATNLGTTWLDLPSDAGEPSAPTSQPPTESPSSEPDAPRPEHHVTMGEVPATVGNGEGHQRSSHSFLFATLAVVILGLVGVVLWRSSRQAQSETPERAPPTGVGARSVPTETPGTAVQEVPATEQSKDGSRPAISVESLPTDRTLRPVRPIRPVHSQSRPTRKAPAPNPDAQPKPAKPAPPQGSDDKKVDFGF